MCDGQSFLLDYIPLPLPHSAPSLLLPSHDLGGHFGQIAEQSLLTPVTQHTEYNFGATTEESRVSTVQEEQHAHPSSSSSSQSDRW